ncbi:ATP synthase gamma chain-like [Rattus rattus]|uniref:ATP synthase gamma chain-like n=1 Tax=Rattus rattus TaxID=10117 RepID=UPI0013F2C2DB|nr:ATP synthase gamma chain-like [Rattus rattus]
MCGDINDRVMKHLQSSFRPKTDALVVVGKRLASHLSSGFGDKIMIAMSSEMRPKDSRNNLRDIVKNVFDTFMNENYQRLSILYVKDHKSGTLDKVTVLPFREDYFEGRKKVFVKTWDHKMSYPNAIFDLFPQYLECIFLSAVINSKLGEHSVRREMMHNATKNATELLDGYKLLFNKMRQSSITQEITEIVVASKFKKKK